MDKFDIFLFSNCHSFLSSSKCFVRYRMCMLDNIIILRKHLGFIYVHENKFLG